MPQTTPRRAAEFVDTIGVNTHINWNNAELSWGSFERTRAALAGSGIKHVRDTVPYEGWTLPVYEAFADMGVRFLILPNLDDFNRTGSLRTDFGHIAKLVRSRPNAIAGLEGFNEVNNWGVNIGGTTTKADIRKGRDLQALHWRERNADPVMKSLPLTCLTVASLTPQQAFAALGNLSAVADSGTWHNYFPNGDQPRAMLQMGYDAARLIVPNTAPILSETGYYSDPEAAEWGLGGGVSPAVQAKLTLNLLLVAFQIGWRRTYLYELMDDNADVARAKGVEGSFGIFRGDATPKPAGAAIRRLLDLMRDPSPDALRFEPRPLDLTLSGMPAAGRSMLFQKSDGAFVLALWNEADLWDQANRRELQVPTSQVRISITGRAQRMTAASPYSGNEAHASDVGEWIVALAEYPVFVTMTGVASAGSAPQPTPQPQPAPSSVAVTAALDGAAVLAALVKSRAEAAAAAAKSDLDAANAVLTRIAAAR